MRGWARASSRKTGELCEAECTPCGGWSLRGLGLPRSSARREASRNKGSQEGPGGRGCTGHSCLLTGQGARAEVPCRGPPALFSEQNQRPHAPEIDRLRIKLPPHNRSHTNETLLPESCSPSPRGQGWCSQHGQGPLYRLRSAEDPAGGWGSWDVGGLSGSSRKPAL